jgi:two-component sensor histidine kinase
MPAKTAREAGIGPLARRGKPYLAPIRQFSAMLGLILDFLIRLNCRMGKLIEAFRRGWRGAQPSSLFSIGFAACCLVLSTLARWWLSLIRPDIFFTPYVPAVVFATAFGGWRLGTATTIAGGLLGLTVNFAGAPTDLARAALLLIFLVVCGFTIWGIEHFRAVATRQREISRRLIEEEKYRELLVDELQHRLKNKLSTVHAVLHQVLHDQPDIWATIDGRLRALAATDDLIARVDNRGCDIKDLLLSELGPYGHIRFTLDGEPLFLPAKLAVSLALIFHELATNASKYGAFSSTRGLLQVSWFTSDDRLNVVWDETEGPPVGPVGQAGFGTKLLNSALRSFDGGTEIAYLKTGIRCTMHCRVPKA